MFTTLLVAGIAAGASGVVCWFISRAALEERLRAREERIALLEREALESASRIDDLLAEQSRLLARASELQARMESEAEAKTRLSDAFKILSSEALDKSSKSFVEMAKATLETFHVSAQGDLTQRQKAIETMVGPIRESLQGVQTLMGDIEKSRKEAYGGIREQVQSLSITQEKLHEETAHLVAALRTPQGRGRWGDIQLRRVVEMAGMLHHCDFIEQKTTTSDEGNRLRPDLVVRLPGGKQVVVDAKAPLAAYLDALETKTDEERVSKMADHAKQVRAHMEKLGSKNYWDQFEASPEFVFMFLPGESFFSAALQQDPSLIEFDANKRVILASPTSLIALLRAVAYGWQQEKIAENAQAISDLGRDLYDRISILVEHIQKVGRGLDSAVEAFNKAVGSIETRVLPAARKFPELGVSDKKPIPVLEPIEKVTRVLQVSEASQEGNPAPIHREITVAPRP